MTGGDGAYPNVEPLLRPQSITIAQSRQILTLHTGLLPSGYETERKLQRPSRFRATTGGTH